MIVFPNAKINLGLHVLRKREDGFHELETCMIPVPIWDSMEIHPSNDFSFTQHGTIINDGKKNLVEQAYDLLKEQYDIPPVSIEMIKNIPTGAGLGGGSSDCAFTIKAINDIFNLEISLTKMKELAAQLGSDNAFFIKNKPQFATGRGEILIDIDLNKINGYYIVLVNPGIHISTAEAYGGVTPQAPEEPLIDILKQPISYWKDNLINDFCTEIYMSYPKILSIEEELYALGAEYAAMSGAGSTVFGLFKQVDEKAIKNKFNWCFSHTDRLQF